MFSSLIDVMEIRGGLDIAIAGEKAYVTSPSLGCVFVYVIVGLTPPLPPRPYELTIMWKDDGVQLLWNAQPGALNYRVERTIDSEFAPASIELLGTTTDTTFMDELSDNAHDLYYYRVTAETAVSGGSAARDEWRAREVRDGLDTEHDSPHHVTHGVNCNSCHLLPFTEPSPRPEWWDTDHLCKSCHVETGFAKQAQTHLGGDTLTCTICHSPHYQQEQFPHYFINNINPVNESDAMLFNHETDFVHGAPDYNGICEICHTQTSYYQNNSSGDHTHHSGSDCVVCHKHENGFYPTAGGGSCNACHGAPPATGAHWRHYGGTVEQASYGSSVNLSTDTSYIFSCGTCHPSSSEYHQNGTVEVELYDADAPNGSLKALNPPTASYAPGTNTCSNVYCHSASGWASTAVGDPIIGTNSLPELDANRNLTYDPYQVTTYRDYADVNWNGGALDCNGCHRNGPQTSYPTVEAGVGTSHGWIDDYGYEDLHAWNMASDPLTCRVCHYGTVSAEQTWSRNVWDVTTYDDVPVANKALHVNGQKNVQFDPVNGGTVRDTTFSLAAASYNSSERTCSSVPCHLTQPEPEWGKPYRWWNEYECDQCHNYSGVFGFGTILENTHPPMNGQSCARCHDAHPHD
ncbi:MAG: hypothetical protein IPG71_10835 [bacterium]|nr:hypothetical protein [bacterium]